MPSDQVSELGCIMTMENEAQPDIFRNEFPTTIKPIYYCNSLPSSATVIAVSYPSTINSPPGL